MTKILYKLFIKNYEDTKNPKVREQYGKLTGAVGIVSNLFICILKITLTDSLVFANDYKYFIDFEHNTASREECVIDIVF